VRTAAEAKDVVAAAKYPPLGSRGFSTGLAYLGFRSVPAAEALPAMNQATMVIVQLESAAALAAIEDIVAVEGVDLVLIGTNDLLADLGRPGEYDHPKVRETYERTIATCRKQGKHAGVGGLGARPDLVQQCVAMGARFVATGTELGFLLAAPTERAQQVRKLRV
jgi:4-hydroxy-2-oxoheptanedioate aldolase